jgi:hypothetical protein
LVFACLSTPSLGITSLTEGEVVERVRAEELSTPSLGIT